MSAKGQKRTFRHSFDHLFGASEQCRRNSETECLSGLQVDDKLKIGRLLNREVGGFFTFQDFIDIDSRAAKLIEVARRVRNETPGVDIGPVRVCSGQPAGCGKVHDLRAMRKQEAIRQYDHCIGFHTGNRCEGALEIINMDDLDNRLKRKA